MKALFCFLLGLVVGVAGHWYFTHSGSNRIVTEARPLDRDAVTNATPATNRVLDLDTESIRDELKRTGKVIRENARKAGNVIADATANARTTASIKTKLLNDSSLSALKIDVDSNDGVVTLSGTVSSEEEVARAVNLALQTEGVDKVISTLQVKPK